MREMGDTLREMSEIDCGRNGRYIMGEIIFTLWGRREALECYNHVTS